MQNTDPKDSNSFDLTPFEEQFTDPELLALNEAVGNPAFGPNGVERPLGKLFTKAERQFAEHVIEKVDELLDFSQLATNSLFGDDLIEASKDQDWVDNHEDDSSSRYLDLDKSIYPELFDKYDLSGFIGIYIARHELSFTNRAITLTREWPEGEKRYQDDSEATMEFLLADAPEYHAVDEEKFPETLKSFGDYYPSTGVRRKGFTITETRFGTNYRIRTDEHLRPEDEIILLNALALAKDASILAQNTIS